MQMLWRDLVMQEKPTEIRLQLFGQETEKLLLGLFLDGLIGVSNGGGVVFYRGRHIACDDFAAVMIERGHNDRVDIELPPEMAVVYQTECVRNSGDLPAMFHHILIDDIALEPPSL